MFRHGITFLMVVLIFAGCSQGNSVSLEGGVAKQFLEDKGYRVIEHLASVEPFILTEKDLSETSQMQIWQVQTVDVEEFVGKEIHGEIFEIENHPLDNYDSGTIQGLGKTQIYLMLVDDKIIGGTSFPITEEALYGAPYSLEGKSFGQLYPNENWREWADRWMEKFKN